VDTYSPNSQALDDVNMVNNERTYVVQKYLQNPALIEGYKFDLRIYVLVTSMIEPMQIMIFKDGLVRLASEPYDRTTGDGEKD